LTSLGRANSQEFLRRKAQIERSGALWHGVEVHANFTRAPEKESLQAWRVAERVRVCCKWLALEYAKLIPV
jgi:hypothetical protein